MNTETLQLILNIRLLFDENTGHSREQDRYTLTQGNAATLICIVEYAFRFAIYKC